MGGRENILNGFDIVMVQTIAEFRHSGCNLHEGDVQYTVVRVKGEDRVTLSNWTRSFRLKIGH